MLANISTHMLLLGLVYAMLAFLLLCLCLATRWAWWIKAIAVLAVSGFYMVSHNAWQSLAGWPSDEVLPKRFVLLSAVFDEPNPARNQAGSIFIWVHPMEDNQPLALPRAYRLPYEKDLRRILGDGIKKARDGNTQMGSTEPKRGPSGLTWLRPAGNENVSIKLSDVPRAQLPEK